jgi:hypothetical protein
MACEVLVHGRVVLVVWGTPELQDLILVEKTVMSVYDSRGPVVFVARVPPSGGMPDEHVRAEITRMLGRFMKRLVSYHAVMEGRGFVAAAKRTVLATSFLLAGQRHSYHVHSTVDEVAPAVPPVHRHEVHAAMINFQRNGHFATSLRPQPRAHAS